MQYLTLRILAVFIVSGILKIVLQRIFGGGFLGMASSVAIDLGVLGYVYLLLRSYRYINLQRIMTFLGGITAVSILTEVRLLPADIGSLIILGVIAWMLFGKGGFFSGGGYRGGGGGRRLH